MYVFVLLYYAFILVLSWVCLCCFACLHWNGCTEYYSITFLWCLSYFVFFILTIFVCNFGPWDTLKFIHSLVFLLLLRSSQLYIFFPTLKCLSELFFVCDVIWTGVNRQGKTRWQTLDDTGTLSFEKTQNSDKM